MRNNSILEMNQVSSAGVDIEADGMVIAPAASINTHAKSPMATRNSMAIRANLRPLLAEERIEQTNKFMKDFSEK